MRHYSRYGRRRRYRSRMFRQPPPWWRSWLWAAVLFIVVAVVLNVPGDPGDGAHSALRWLINARPDLQLGEMVSHWGHEWWSSLPVLGGVDDQHSWEQIKGALMVPVAGEVTSEFGWRQGIDSEMEFHEGVDFAVAGRQIVVAAYGGTVTSVRTSPVYGQTLEIDHGGDVQTFYGRLSDLFVSDKEAVIRGDRIGAVDEDVGPLHFEVRFRGVPVDPQGWFSDMKY